jgi:hypothetical protein
MDATVSCELGGVRRSEWEVVDMGGNINFKVWKWGAAGVGAEVGSGWSLQTYNRLLTRAAR